MNYSFYYHSIKVLNTDLDGAFLSGNITYTEHKELKEIEAKMMRTRNSFMDKVENEREIQRFIRDNEALFPKGHSRNELKKLISSIISQTFSFLNFYDEENYMEREYLQKALEILFADDFKEMFIDAITSIKDSDESYDLVNIYLAIYLAACFHGNESMKEEYEEYLGAYVTLSEEETTSLHNRYISVISEPNEVDNYPVSEEDEAKLKEMYKYLEGSIYSYEDYHDLMAMYLHVFNLEEYQEEVNNLGMYAYYKQVFVRKINEASRYPKDEENLKYYTCLFMLTLADYLVALIPANKLEGVLEKVALTKEQNDIIDYMMKQFDLDQHITNYSLYLSIMISLNDQSVAKALDNVLVPNLGYDHTDLVGRMENLREHFDVASENINQFELKDLVGTFLYANIIDPLYVGIVSIAYDAAFTHLEDQMGE